MRNPVTPLSFGRRFAAGCAACTLCGIALLGVGGCAGRENAVEDKGTETAYLRLPDQEKSASSLSPSTSTTLFPTSIGSRWEMETMQGLWKASAGQQQNEVKISRSAAEVIKVTGQTTLGGQAGFIFEIADTAVAASDAKANSSTVRQEVYSVTGKGLFLLAAGGKAGQMTMSPPLQIIAYPPKEGGTIQWSGVLHYKNATVPASSLSRISGVQTVKNKAIPKGIAAYRVDTIISTTLNTGQVNFPTTRWLAPGIGMVRQKLIAGDQLVVKELRSYEIAQK